MKISIAMATHNGGKYLQEQLDSFVEQTSLPEELVVCDDVSSDETLCILSRFKEIAPFRVNIISNQRKLGYAQNFGRALSECSGDLVFLSDQDDVWFTKKLEIVQMVAEKDHYAQLFINDAELVYEDLTPTRLTKLGQLKSADIGEKSFIMGCCAAVRRDFLKYLLPIPLRFSAHDSWIVGFAEGLGRKRIIYETLQYYRRHKNNTSQFVANQTRRISKYNRLLSQVQKALAVPEYRGLYRASYNLNEFRCRAEDWVKQSNDRILKQELRSFIKKTEKTKSHIEARIAVREHGRFVRIFYAMRLLYAGVYKESGGIQGYLRDVLF